MHLVNLSVHCHLLKLSIVQRGQPSSDYTNVFLFCLNSVKVQAIIMILVFLRNKAMPSWGDVFSAAGPVASKLSCDCHGVASGVLERRRGKRWQKEAFLMGGGGASVCH